MQRPAVIITSRSQDTGMLNVSFDLYLEALGLSPMSVDAYLNNTEIVPSDTAPEILHFIERKAFIKGMVRVPIHLDILCYSWNELHLQNSTTELTLEEEQNVVPTTTALYQAVVRSLWRKDVRSLGKLDHGEPVTAEVIDAVRDSARLERLVDTESSFLEEIANKMMESDRLEFTDKDIIETVQLLELNGNRLPLSLERNLNRISLLRSYGGERHRKYCFIHLTFQEFFYARYLARCMARDRASFESLLRQHKYDRRYEVVWMFFTGLLSKVEQLDCFFDLLDDGPQDLVGIQHVQLIMYCLSECQTRTRPSHWNEYQGRLEEWYRLEDRIGSSMAFPEELLLKQLLSNAKSIPTTLAETICRRNSLSAEFIEKINQLIDDMSVSGEYFTIYILAPRINLTETTISFFLEQIQEMTEQKEMAFRILKRQRHLPNTAIERLCEWLNDPRLRYYANQIMGSQAFLPKETIDNTFETLMDQESPDSLGYRSILGGGSVCLRPDLHVEAAAKVWEFLEQAVSRNVRIPNDILSKLCRLHPDYIEKSGEILKMRLDADGTALKLFAARILGQQRSLPTNILKVVVELLSDELDHVRREARQILQRQPGLHPDIIHALRRFFEAHKDEVVTVLKERLQLSDRAWRWLSTQISRSTVKYQETVDYILGQSDLPDFFVDSLVPKFMLGGEGAYPTIIFASDFDKVVRLLYQQRTPSDKLISLIIRSVPSDKLIFPQVPEVINQDAFADPLIKALEEANNQRKADNIAELLQQNNLNDESVKRLRALINTKLLTEMAAIKAGLAVHCLVRQVKLDPNNILDLHKFILEMQSPEEEKAALLDSLWKNRHVEHWCANLAFLDNDSIHRFLKDFLQRSVGRLSPAYINGKTIYYYAADGKLTEQRLEDEDGFRKRFREAQRTEGIPEWAWMKPPKAESKELSDNVSGELIVR